MFYFLTTFIIFLISTSANASGLPDWFKPRAKEIMVDKFVETMKNYPEYYKISEISVAEGALNSGQPAAFIDVNFEDSKMCEKRQFSGKCFPLNKGKQEYVFCFVALSDCVPAPSVSKSILRER
jgi:hypothetical protein